MRLPLIHLSASGWFVMLAVLAAFATSVPVLATTTADHSKFKQLQEDFESGPEVTKACLGCHTEAAKQIHKTKHWTWEVLNPNFEQKLGKKNVLNNFCVAAPSNYAFCTTCHVGYGWKDDTFDFTSEVNVDCLVCHDTTGSYAKAPGRAGHPQYEPVESPPGSGKFRKPIDLTRIAQKVGKTSRDTCGACHFFGGGGDGVKHGDMDSSLAVPDEDLDVHMDALGNDFTCTTCHKGSGHDVAGSRYAPTAMDRGEPIMRGKPKDKNRNPATCHACHGQRPHSAAQAKLNDHTRKIACQTCHIPKLARGGVATKTSWDWSQAGQLSPEGQPILKKDDHGHVIYNSKKGAFTVAENIDPEYVWFNGRVKYTLVGDKVEKGAEITWINRFEGGPADGESRIWPVKVFHSVQPYDPVNKSLVVPHLAGNDNTAYWKNFDWQKAVTVGMASIGAPFSGKVDFIETKMAWPVTHMIAPKEKALACDECHSKNGRLEGIEGVYLPSRDGNRLLDLAGWSIALIALIAVIVHAGLRIATRKK
ncbi:MAG: cytochrome C [Gammaproteobacteria bacterium SG8_47]|nr:MAG: cytochrome C [Gammaproteobacteria bacterium SG8_47]